MIKQEKYLTEEHIYEMSFEKLGINKAKVDRMHEIAELLDLEFDEAADAYINPNYEETMKDKLIEVLKVTKDKIGGRNEFICVAMKRAISDTEDIPWEESCPEDHYPEFVKWIVKVGLEISATGQYSYGTCWNTGNHLGVSDYSDAYYDFKRKKIDEFIEELKCAI